MKKIEGWMVFRDDTPMEETYERSEQECKASFTKGSTMTWKEWLPLGYTCRPVTITIEETKTT